MRIYCRTNTVNNKVYIGQTMKDCAIRWKGCISEAEKGRGGHLGGAIRKYGPDVFKEEILYQASSKYELDQMERFFIILYQSHIYENGYNMTLGGEGCSGFHHSEESKRKISSFRKGKMAWNKGKVCSWRGKKHDPDWSKAIADSLRGKPSPRAGKTNIEVLGEERAKEIRKRISVWKLGRIWITNGINSKQITKSDAIPIGWRLGFTKVNRKKHFFSDKYKGRVWITNGVSSKKITKEERIPDGWKYGRPFKKRNTNKILLTVA